MCVSSLAGTSLATPKTFTAARGWASWPARKGCVETTQLRARARGARARADLPHDHPRTGQTCAGMYDFDLVVIGSGPAGQRAAVQAAKLGRTVALVERRAMVGGVCVNTGTIPSKTLREAVVYLTGMSQREMYGQSYRVKSDITMDDLRERTN